MEILIGLEMQQVKELKTIFDFSQETVRIFWMFW